MDKVCILIIYFTLRKENIQDLERVQKSAMGLILQESYNSYPNALKVSNLETLADRRELLCLEFAKRYLNNRKMKHLFPRNNKTHSMKNILEETYKIETQDIKRLMKSTVIYMQRLLVPAECVRCPWAAGINVVATLNGIICLLSFFLSHLLFYQKEGRQGHAILHGFQRNQIIGFQ